MRIHQTCIFPLHGSGSGVNVHNLCTSLSRRGHTINALCVDHYPTRRSYPVETILFSNGQNQAFDLDFNFPCFTSHPLSRETTFGNMTPAQKRAYYAAFKDRLEGEIARFKPDIAHTHHGWIVGAILAELGVPYVISLQGTEHLGFTRYPDYRELALRGLRGASMIIALTGENLDQAFATYGIEPAKFVIIPTGIDTEVFRPVEVDRSAVLAGFGVEDSGRPIVLFVGKLTGFKGVDVLLRAAAIYSRSDEQPITLIAGDGDLRASLEMLARDLGLGDVHFVGNQSHERLIELYNIAAVLAFPSLTDFFPLVAMEALACGTPIVASAVGGLRQIVDERVGYLVPPGDHATLAEQITAVLRGRFKDRAHESIVAYTRQTLGLEAMTEKVEQVYEAVLGGQPARSIPV